MIFEDFNLNRTDWKYLCILFILIVLSFAKYIEFIMSGGILNVDSALYLISSLKYAGMDYYNIVNPLDLYFSPIISFLTSLLFRWGMVDRVAIAIVSMIISFSGYFGMYILFKNRFNSLLSFTGVIIFGCFSIVIFNMPQGMIDLPAVAICIWTLVFAVAAIDKNPKYFLIVFPLLVIGFFTKYIVGFALPLILLYYLMKRDFIANIDCLFQNPSAVKEKLTNYLKSSEFKYILISIIVSVILAVVICKTLILDYGGSLTFFSQSLNTFNGHEMTQNKIYFPEKSHYLKGLKTILFENRQFGSVYAYLLYAFLGLGIVICIVNFIRNKKTILTKRDSFKTKHFDKLLAVLFVAFMAGSFYGFKYMSNHMVSNICLLIAITILFSILQKYTINEAKVSFDLLMLAFFSVYFIFLSIYPLKAMRYAIPFLPPFVYFVIWGLNNIMGVISNRYEDEGPYEDSLSKSDNEMSYIRLANVIPIVLVLVLVITTAMFLAPQEIDDSNYDFNAVHYQGFVNDLRDACDFIKQNDSDYHSKSFASISATSRPIKWYLQTNVTVIDGNAPDMKNIDNTTYIILKSNRTLNNYKKIYNEGDFTVYRHK